MAKIPSVERLVLMMYFEDGLTLRKIGELLGVNQSRVSQIKSRGILRLRAHVMEHWPGYAEHVRCATWPNRDNP
jgi:DNA-directed RNA polymerase specialized sigma subunit